MTTVKCGATARIERSKIRGNPKPDPGLRTAPSGLRSLDTLDGYAIVNLRGKYRISKHLSAFALIENLFDTDYETFGLLSEPEGSWDPPLTIHVF